MESDDFTYISKVQLAKLKSLIWKFRNYNPQPVIGKEDSDYSPYYVDFIFTKLNLLTKRKDQHLLAYKHWEYSPETFLVFSDPTNREWLNKTQLAEQHLFNNINVPLTVNGIWQAYILHDLWCTALPLFDHANYSRVEIYIGQKDLKYTISYGNPYKDAFNKIKQGNLPAIKLMDDNTAFIRVALWSNWGGWIEATTKVRWENGIVKFLKSKTKIIAKYDCGIVF